MFDKAISRAHVGPWAPGVAMVYSLGNRFGEELIRLEIPAGRFHRDRHDREFVVAAGSAPLAEADYREIISAEGRSLSWNYLDPLD
jgi:hypothetical protein